MHTALPRTGRDALAYYAGIGDWGPTAPALAQALAAALPDAQVDQLARLLVAVEEYAFGHGVATVDAEWRARLADWLAAPAPAS